MQKQDPNFLVGLKPNTQKFRKMGTTRFLAQHVLKNKTQDGPKIRYHRHQRLKAKNQKRKNKSP